MAPSGQGRNAFQRPGRNEVLHEHSLLIGAFSYGKKHFTGLLANQLMAVICNVGSWRRSAKEPECAEFYVMITTSPPIRIRALSVLPTERDLIGLSRCGQRALAFGCNTLHFHHFNLSWGGKQDNRRNYKKTKPELVAKVLSVSTLSLWHNLSHFHFKLVFCSPLFHATFFRT